MVGAALAVGWRAHGLDQVVGLETYALNAKQELTDTVLDLLAGG